MTDQPALQLPPTLADILDEYLRDHHIPGNPSKRRAASERLAVHLQDRGLDMERASALDLG